MKDQQLFLGKNRPILVAVIGGQKITAKVGENAKKLGNLLAEMGVIVVCGGLGGVMESVSRGVRMKGGLTIGILPGNDKKAANPCVDIAIPTGLGLARNTIVVGCADIVIALPGEYGTLSEVAFALNRKKIVIGIGSWKIRGMRQVKTPQGAVRLIERLLKSRVKRIKRGSWRFFG